MLRWQGPEGPDSNILYYTIEKRKDSQGETWKRISKNIDVEEASYMSKNHFFIELKDIVVICTMYRELASALRFSLILVCHVIMNQI